LNNIFRKYYSVILSLIVFVIYLITLAPSVIQIDSGELAAVQILAGIAHPTGYPLFTIVGYLFSKLPIFTSKIFQMNLLAALWCVLALIFFTKNLELVFKIIEYDLLNQRKRKNKNFKNNELVNQFNKDEIIYGSVFALILLAFSRTYWNQSVSVEVYSLQIFLMLVIIYFILDSILHTKKHAWLKVAAALALGFANHMTTLLLLPGLAFLFFNKEGFNKNAIKTILKMLLLFFALLIVIYSYLPLRAASNPILNWGNPVDWEKFWRHFTGKQYQVWMFSSVDAAKLQLLKYLNNLPLEFSYLGLALAIIGFFHIRNLSRKIFIYFLINFLFTLFYVINYNIHDLDSYFLLSYITLSLTLPFAFNFLKKKNLNSKIISGIFIIAILWEFIPNFNFTNQSNNYAFADYTKTILSNADSSAVILSYQWDYFVSPSYYFRFVENFRKDVAVVDKELLRRSWYYNQLNRNYPFLLKNIKSTVKNFRMALRPFESGKKYNSILLEKYYREIISGIIAGNIQKHSIYLLPEMVDNELRKKEFILPAGYTIAPYYYCYKVVKVGKYLEEPMNIEAFRFPAKENYYLKFIRKISAEMLLKRAIYELQFNKREKAKYFVNKAVEFFNGFRLPPALKALLN